MSAVRLLVVVGVIAVGAACDESAVDPSSAVDASTGTELGSEATAATDRSDLVDDRLLPATSDDRNVVMEIKPAVAVAGEMVTVSFAGELGDLDGSRLTGVDLSIEQRVQGEWRTMWAVLSDQFEVPPISLTPTVEHTVPPVGVLLSASQRFVLPDALVAGEYRDCMPFVDQQGPSAPICGTFTVG